MSDKTTIGATTERWTERLVFDKLSGPFPSPAHVRLPQLRNGTGFSRRQTRTADAIIASVYPSRGLWLAGVEIKVSQYDWKKELADADKAADFMRWCRYWYVAAPAGVVDVAELPETWGYIEVGRICKIVVKAPALNPVPPDMSLMCSVLRNVADGFTPNGDVQKKAESMAEDKALRASNQLEMLKKDIDEFEKASGVKLSDHWGHERIGEAVKFVLATFLGHSLHQLTKLRDEAAFVVEGCDKIAAAAKASKGGPVL